LGYQYYRGQRYPEAVENYALVLKLDPRYVLTYYTLGNAYRLTNDLRLAHAYHRHVTILLEDETVTSLQRNQGEWFFHTEGREIHFYDYPKKKCYAYYNLALSAFLWGARIDSINSYVQKAREMETATEWEVISLIRHDIETIKRTRPTLTSKLDEFESMIMGR